MWWERRPLDDQTWAAWTVARFQRAGVNAEPYITWNTDANENIIRCWREDSIS